MKEDLIAVWRENLLVKELGKKNSYKELKFLFKNGSKHGARSKQIKITKKSGHSPKNQIYLNESGINEHRYLNHIEKYWATMKTKISGNEQVKSDPLIMEKIPCISPKIFDALTRMRDQLKRIVDLI